MMTVQQFSLTQSALFDAANSNGFKIKFKNRLELALFLMELRDYK